MSDASNIVRAEKAANRGHQIKKMVALGTRYVLALSEMLYIHVKSGDYKREMQSDVATIRDYFNHEIKISPDHGFTLLRIHDALKMHLGMSDKELDGLSHKKLYALTRYAERSLGSESRRGTGKQWEPMNNDYEIEAVETVLKNIRRVLSIKAHTDRDGFTLLVDGLKEGKTIDEIQNCTHDGSIKRQVKEICGNCGDLVTRTIETVEASGGAGGGEVAETSSGDTGGNREEDIRRSKGRPRVPVESVRCNHTLCRGVSKCRYTT